MTRSLPPGPDHRTGWPWVPSDGSYAGDAGDWPRISIVTPSYNQGAFLEETIRSVLMQGYPNLEYIVIDGGSTDESVSVIRKYEKWLAHWVSEPDEGQAHAINKGLRLCTGEIFQFVNSDDYLAPGALECVAREFRGGDSFAGCVVDFDDKQCVRRACRDLVPRNFIRLPPGFLYHQPGVWLRTSYVRQLNGFDATLRYKFDWELMIRYLERWPKVTYSDESLVYFRLHPASKTVAEADLFWPEEWRAREILFHKLITLDARKAFDRAIRQRHWRSRIDEMLADRNSSGSRVVDLITEALQDPVHRIDRYSIRALKRLLKRSRQDQLKRRRS